MWEGVPGCARSWPRKSVRAGRLAPILRAFFPPRRRPFPRRATGLLITSAPTSIGCRSRATRWVTIGFCRGRHGPVRARIGPGLGGTRSTGCHRRSPGTAVDTLPRPSPGGRGREATVSRCCLTLPLCQCRRPVSSRVAESRSIAKGGRLQFRRRCSRLTVDTQLEAGERDPDTRDYRKPALLPGAHVGSGLRIEEALPLDPADQAVVDFFSERRQQLTRADHRGRPATSPAESLLFPNSLMNTGTETGEGSRPRMPPAAGAE